MQILPALLIGLASTWGERRQERPSNQEGLAWFSSVREHAVDNFSLG